MTPKRFTRSKFISLPERRQHKNAGELLRLALTRDPGNLAHYRELEHWLALPEATTREALYDRFHWHMEQAAAPLHEKDFLPEMRRFDRVDPAPARPVGLYLDHLRSAANIGNILRTAESFGIKNIGFSPDMPGPDHPKVVATAKGVLPYLDCHRDLERLPRPFIALETAQGATPIGEFDFPESFTLLLGNEEYGLSSDVFHSADHVVEIPLLGVKNSINVSAAFSIAAFATCTTSTV